MENGDEIVHKMRRVRIRGEAHRERTDQKCNPSNKNSREAEKMDMSIWRERGR